MSSNGIRKQRNRFLIIGFDNIKNETNNYCYNSKNYNITVKETDKNNTLLIFTGTSILAPFHIVSDITVPPKFLI